jgi:hypothetical protein
LGLSSGIIAEVGHGDKHEYGRAQKNEQEDITTYHIIDGTSGIIAYQLRTRVATLLGGLDNDMS